MSDCSDSDDSDYVPVEERELIIGSAIDTAKTGNGNKQCLGIHKQHGDARDARRHLQC